MNNSQIDGSSGGQHNKLLGNGQAGQMERTSIEWRIITHGLANSGSLWDVISNVSEEARLDTIVHIENVEHNSDWPMAIMGSLCLLPMCVILYMEHYW